MTRKILFTILYILCTLMLCACQCKHDWQEADCVNPRICTRCKEASGEPLGHSLSPATCRAPSTCSVCGRSVGSTADHSWEAATCTDPMRCSVCSATSGEPLGHNWSAAVNQSGIEGRMCMGCGELVMNAERWLPLSKCEKTNASNEDAHFADIVVGDWNTRAGKLPDSIRFCVSGKEDYLRTHYCVYKLNENFDYLSGLISFDDQSENYATARIQIYLDNELEFESNTISDVTRDQSFTLDVQGVQNVRIVCTTSDSHTAYCVLSASVY